MGLRSVCFVRMNVSAQVNTQYNSIVYFGLQFFAIALFAIVGSLNANKMVHTKLVCLNII